jgi:DNA (cytosine-5)-methyltransferase 1
MTKSVKKLSRLKFIDLFAGVGGFHQALKSFGHECVYASEINKFAADVYKRNYGIDPLSDITKVAAIDIPKHDILCAGFPCQAFSNAGKKQGFDDVRGTLFFDIKRILDYHKPKFIVLENVKHLVKHDGGNTWQVIKTNLDNLGYAITEQPLILSPHQFGVPQNRPRVYILGVLKDKLNSKITKIELNLEKFFLKDKTSIYSILDSELKDPNLTISEYEEKVINAWEEFRSGIGKKVYGFPVWVDEFGQKYSYDHFPKWKQDYIFKIRELYNSHKSFIDSWIKKWDVKNFKLRDRKFEWQAGPTINSVWDTSIQLRQSGIRFKKPDFFPALVAMVQTPIIAKYKRRISPREASFLQSYPENFQLDTVAHRAYRQFGNSVNIKVLKIITGELLKKYGEEK